MQLKHGIDIAVAADKVSSETQAYSSRVNSGSLILLRIWKFRFYLKNDINIINFRLRLVNWATIYSIFRR